MAKFHDPVPDGRSGPFMRKSHRLNPSGFGYAYDPRCPLCREETCPAGEEPHEHEVMHQGRS